MPKTRSQWKSALVGVKLLYAQRQYKQCAARSAELLQSATEPVHPVHESYLHFYSAISYEILGEVAHKYSKNKLPLLRAALDSFVACSAVLPATIPAPGGPEEVDDDEQVPSPETAGDASTPSESDLSEGSSSAATSLLSSITRIIDRSIDLPDGDDPFVSENEDYYCVDPMPFRLPLGNTEKTHLMPSPLQIRKSSGEFGSVCLAPFEPLQKPVARMSQTGRGRKPPPLPIKIVPPAEAKGFISRQVKGCDEFSELTPNSDSSVARRPPQSAYPHAQSIMRYNSNIEFVRARVGSRIADIQALVDEVAEIQHTRRVSKTIRRSASFWSFSPVKDQSQPGENSPRRSLDSRRETREQRIARLRAEGWNTVGLKSETRGWKGTEYYREFCDAVLGEMYAS
ncbi:hypothetical protein PHISP_00061 [Aspergillus sp. HF37]|nr:hypothetical protein PHISP_00061 [Aspergillus sp. HF37]